MRALSDESRLASYAVFACRVATDCAKVEKSTCHGPFTVVVFGVQSCAESSVARRRLHDSRTI